MWSIISFLCSKPSTGSPSTWSNNQGPHNALHGLSLVPVPFCFSSPIYSIIALYTRFLLLLELPWHTAASELLYLVLSTVCSLLRYPHDSVLHFFPQMLPPYWGIPWTHYLKLHLNGWRCGIFMQWNTIQP